MSIIVKLDENYQTIFETLNKLDTLVYCGDFHHTDPRTSWIDEIKMGLRIHLYALSGIFDDSLQTQISSRIEKSHIQSNYRFIQAILDELDQGKLTHSKWLKKAYIIKNLIIETLTLERDLIAEHLSKESDSHHCLKTGWKYTTKKMSMYAHWLCA